LWVPSCMPTKALHPNVSHRRLCENANGKTP
jgi:hypothetical protein